jgi:hypothetical protein
VIFLAAVADGCAYRRRGAASQLNSNLAIFDRYPNQWRSKTAKQECDREAAPRRV